jgi:hypothetical protein
MNLTRRAGRRRSLGGFDMQKDVHAAALRAAAKVAFSVAFLGCSSPAKSPGSAQEASGDEGYDTVTSDVTEAPAKGSKGAASAAPAPAKPPCHEDAGTTTAKSCKEVVASAFPDAGWVNPGEGSIVGDDVKACCTELLTAGDFPDFPERWACCSAVDAFGAGGQNLGIACTPWGPPVPPAMRRKPTKPTTPRPVHEAWLEVA